MTLLSSPTSLVVAKSITVVFPGVIQSTGPGQTLTVGNGLQTQTLDLEGTQCLSFGPVDAVVGMGLRYASLRQSFQATITRRARPNSSCPASGYSKDWSTAQR